jgi:hypothetical protein
MFDLRMFRKPTFSGASIAAMTLSAGMFAMFLYITLFMQTILGFSPLQAGLRFLPFTVLSFFVAGAAGKLTAVAPVRLLLFGGLALTGAGLMLMRGLDATSGWTALLPGFLVAGAGVGLTNPALASTAIGVVPPARSGMASGINSTFRQVGIATGVAALGSIFASDLTSRLSSGLASIPALGALGHQAGQVSLQIRSGNVGGLLASLPPTSREAMAALARSSFVHSLDRILLIGGVVALVGGVVSLACIRSKDFAEGSQAHARAEGRPAAGRPAPGSGPVGDPAAAGTASG